MSLTWKAKYWDNAFCEMPFVRIDPTNGLDQNQTGPTPGLGWGNYTDTPSTTIHHCSVCLTPVGGIACLDVQDLPTVGQSVYFSTNMFVDSYQFKYSSGVTWTGTYRGLVLGQPTWMCREVMNRTQNYGGGDPVGGVYRRSEIVLNIPFKTGSELDPCSIHLNATDWSEDHVCPPPNATVLGNPQNVPCYTGAGISPTANQSALSLVGPLAVDNPNWFGSKSFGILGAYLGLGTGVTYRDDFYLTCFWD